ncbi:alpha/beta fold hydrolase [Streptomyces calvus]
MLVLGPSLGTTTRIWQAQRARLGEDFRVLRYDLPGHGGSPTGALRDPSPGATTVDDLADAVLALVDDVTGGEEPSAFRCAGISLGGAVGARLALRHPRRVAALALVYSSARFGAEGPWRERAELVRREGMAPLRETSPGRWFADPATARTPVGRALLDDLAAVDPAGYAACCDALAGYDVRAELPAVQTPTLVIGGTHDLATPSATPGNSPDSCPAPYCGPSAAGTWPSRRRTPWSGPWRPSWPVVRRWRGGCRCCRSGYGRGS